MKTKLLPILIGTLTMAGTFCACQSNGQTQRENDQTPSRIVKTTDDDEQTEQNPSEQNPSEQNPSEQNPSEQGPCPDGDCDNAPDMDGENAPCPDGNCPDKNGKISPDLEGKLRRRPFRGKKEISPAPKAKLPRGKHKELPDSDQQPDESESKSDENKSQSRENGSKSGENKSQSRENGSQTDEKGGHKTHPRDKQLPETPDDNSRPRDKQLPEAPDDSDERSRPPMPRHGFSERQFDFYFSPPFGDDSSKLPQDGNNLSQTLTSENNS